MALDHTTPKVVPCKRCWQEMFEGMIEGFKVQANTVPLSIPGQIAALKGKRWLYEVTPMRGTRKVDLRTYSRERILSGRDAIVVTAHICEPMPPEYVDHDGAKVLHDFLHPEPPPALFEPPF